MRITKSKSHLTLDERIEIQSCLDCGVSFKAIALRIGKSQTTVSREIKNNKIKVLKRNAYGYRNFVRFRNRILYCG